MILTKAISGIARAGATRSGYPVLLGHQVPLHALSNVARSGATRSNYVSSKPFITIGGIQRGWNRGDVPGTTYRELVLADGASNYWRLDEASGTTAVDVIGGKDGTISGGVTLNQPGALAGADTAMSFDGTGQIVTAPTVVIPVVISIEAWVKSLPASFERSIVSCRVSAQDIYIGIDLNNALYLYATGYTFATKSITDGGWHHVVVILNGSTGRFYVDGIFDATSGQTRTSPTTKSVEIGRDSFGGVHWVGSLDEVAIYPVALTAAQVAAHYQAGIHGPMRAPGGILAESLTKSDAINTTPATIAFTAYGWVPVEGTDVVITLGSTNNQRREFGGTILSTRHRYVGDKPVIENMLYDAQAIDYTWGLDRRKASGSYTNASVAAIAASLLTFAPSGYTLQVDADIGAEILDQMTITEQTLSSAFTQLAKRVGGSFLCDYSKVVRLFYTNTAIAPPAIVNAVHASMAGITFMRDLSQVATRVLGSFGGSNALDQIAPGATLLPVETAAWYLPQGGVVLVGQQRVTYGGIVTGGGGSLVGPGASPTGAPNVVLLPGAGVDVGTHDYAVTYKTAAGESMPGPRLTVPVGVFLPPATAPTPGTPGPGASGPDPGAHDYAVAFVISSGETVPGPRVVATTGLTPPPDTGPTPDRVDPGPGPDPGTHDYAVAFVTATGLTPAGPIGSQITTGPAPVPPPSAPAPALQLGTGLSVGAYGYATTFVSATGETTPGPTAAVTTSAAPIPPPATPVTLTEVPVGIGDWALQFPVVVSVSFVMATGETTVGPSTTLVTTLSQSQINVSNIPLGPPGTVARYLYRPDYTGSPPTYVPSGNVYRYAINDNVTTVYPRLLQLGTLYSNAGQVGPPTNTAGPQQRVGVASIQTGPTGTTARRLYRTVANGSQLQLLTTLGDNTTTTFSDTTPDASLGANAPTTGTWLQTAQTVHLSSLPRGTGANAAAVTARNLYRRSAGAGLRYVATIADNTTTTYTDTTPNASLGVVPVGVNSATLRVIPLTAIPLGNSLVTARKVYRTPANTGGGTLKLVATIADNVTTTFTDTVNDAALGAAALTVGTAQAAQVQLSAIPLGAAAVTARVLYRTKAGLAQLQLLTTLADNTTTTWLDTALDTTLGANAPISDTSTLQQPTGNVLAGSPTLPCASVAAFRSAGGWAIVGSQNVRYTGLSGNALLGIPATGPGAITATINFNTTAVAAALLINIPTTGLGVIQYTILKGDPVNLFVQVDDLDAQAAVRAQLAGSDGIIEDEIVDGRLGALEGRERCQARLDLLGARDSEGKVGIVTVHYVCRDVNTVAGATVTVNLGPPINLRGDYLIQRVSVAQFNVPNLNPTYTVEASSIRFSAEEMLRLLRQGAY